eukprot:gene2669-3865_t
MSGSNVVGPRIKQLMDHYTYIYDKKLTKGPEDIINYEQLYYQYCTNIQRKVHTGELKDYDSVKKEYLDLLNNSQEPTSVMTRKLMYLCGYLKLMESKEEKELKESKFGEASTFRGDIWCAILLSSDDEFNQKKWFKLLKEKPTEDLPKVSHDVDRATSSKEVLERIPKEGESFYRIIHCFSVEKGAPEDNIDRFGYLQGMLGISTPFQCCMNEPDAYFCYNKLLTEKIPTYFTNNYCGVLSALRIIKNLMTAFTPELKKKFEKLETGVTGMIRTLFFSSITICCSDFSPLSEMLRLWDTFISFGFHLVPIVVFSRMFLVEDELLKPNVDIKTFMQQEMKSSINADQLVTLSINVFQNIPSSLRSQILAHTHNFEFAKKYAELKGELKEK